MPPHDRLHELSGLDYNLTGRGISREQCNATVSQAVTLFTNTMDDTLGTLDAGLLHSIAGTHWPGGLERPRWTVSTCKEKLRRYGNGRVLMLQDFCFLVMDLRHPVRATGGAAVAMGGSDGDGGDDAGGKLKFRGSASGGRAIRGPAGLISVSITFCFSAVAGSGAVGAAELYDGSVSSAGSGGATRPASYVTVSLGGSPTREMARTLGYAQPAPRGDGTTLVYKPMYVVLLDSGMVTSEDAHEWMGEKKVLVRHWQTRPGAKPTVSETVTITLSELHKRSVDGRPLGADSAGALRAQAVSAAILRDDVAVPLLGMD